MGERKRLDDGLVRRGFAQETRAQLWRSVESLLAHGPLSETGKDGGTGLALGYVQSGKTTAITALTAAAADEGYRLVVALLGSTNLLLDQNMDRLLKALEIGERQDYRWVHLRNATGVTKAREIHSWLARDRVVLLPVLKHAGRVNALAEVLSRAEARGLPTLIIDDEADQASLNTQVSNDAQSRTYEALGNLREVVPRHLYVQFTATPYAPLLLEPDDHLSPEFVELLQPGPGYTGGREFFVDNADVVVRAIPTLDEQPAKSPPNQLPRSLVTAVGSFVAGTALLLGVDSAAMPVSMLVHSTQRNNVQARYHFLLQRLFKQWGQIADGANRLDDLPAEVIAERRRITALGAPDLDDPTFLEKVRLVLREATLWLVNSASDVNKVDWLVAPVHVLIGGNKLDRGFTVEGLTVTYMNRPASVQIDTLEQRARAFGYRGDLLPYCQFFATPRTLKVLRETVDTEYDLRANLRDWLDQGHTVASWAEQVGLLLPEGTRPTRQNVLTTLSRFNERTGWHQLRRPSRALEHLEANARLVRDLGLLTAPRRSYGRLEHPTLDLPLADVMLRLVHPWQGVQPGSSPGWRHDELLDLLSRLPGDQEVPVLLMQHPDGGARTREWDVELGFINLFQGADPVQRPGVPAYPGDRAMGDVDTHPERVVVQVHRVRPAGSLEADEMYTLAVHAGQRAVVRRG
jgi:Z1 domain